MKRSGRGCWRRWTVWAICVGLCTLLLWLHEWPQRPKRIAPATATARNPATAAAVAALQQLHLSPQNCTFLFRRGHAGESCSTSRTCGPTQFCHPEQGICAELCKGGRPPDAPPWQYPHAEDVWLVSYPKSGSTWLRHLIWNLHVYNALHSAENPSIPGGAGIAPLRPATFREVDKAIPFLEEGNFLKVFKKQPPLPYTTRLRIFKSHQPYNCDEPPCKGWVVDKQARTQCTCPNCPARFKKVIYLVRDGRAALASYFHFQDQLHLRGTATFAKFLSGKDRRYPGISWSDHIRSWMAAPGPDLDILWVQYEDMKDAPALVLRRVARFLGIQDDADAIVWAVNASSAETMSRTELQSGPGLFERYKKRDPQFRMVHTGGDWRQHFSPSSKKLRGRALQGGAVEGTPEETTQAFMQEHGYMSKCLGYGM